MKANQIKLGGHYTAKVNDSITTVRVDAIRGKVGPFDVTNLKTGRKTTFRSAVKFRGEVKADLTKAVAQLACKSGLPAAESSAVVLGLARDLGRCPYTHDGEHVYLPVTAGGPPAETCTMCAANDRRKPEGEQRPDPTRTAPSAAETVPAGVVGSVASKQPLPCPPTSGAELRSSLVAAFARNAAPADDAPHLIVTARAGTGKTTTLIEGLRLVLGGESTLTPSPQQRAVWDCMALSRGKVRTVGFVAFNRSIAAELKHRVPQGVEAMTIHGLGFRAVRKAFPAVEVNEWRTADIAQELLGIGPRPDVSPSDAAEPGGGKEALAAWNRCRAAFAPVVSAVRELVGLCKMNLTLESDIEATTKFCEMDERLDALASHYDVELNGSRRKVFDLVPAVLERCKDVARDGKIDYDDMIYLPVAVALGLPVARYDLLCVDEAQDLNRCQQALAKLAGRRLVLCGDERQAIYGFAGADAGSMRRMAAELGGDPCRRCAGHGLLDESGKGFSEGTQCPDCRGFGNRGCVTLPLTVTRRCGRAIVREANKIVPDFEAHESNPEGKITEARMESECRDSGQLSGGKPQPRPLRKDEVNYQTICRDGDMVLCRVNAPLVSECFRFIRAGRKAGIQGRDVGAGLVKTVRRLCPDDATPALDLVVKLGTWTAAEEDKERAKRNPSDAKLIALRDRYDCLVCFTEGTKTVGDVLAAVGRVFTDAKDQPGIRLSSIHKAKGLEADRVFLLEPEGASVPHPMAKSDWQMEQEMNLRYVAITRAIKELVYVS